MSIFPDSNSAPPPVGPVGPVGQASASVWPTWFGVIGLVLGGLMLLGSCCGGVMMAGMSMLGKVGNMTLPPMPALMRWIFVVDALITVVLATFLFWGGISLLRRRAKGRTMLVRYAVIRVVLAVPLFVAGFLAMKPNGEWSAAMASAQIDAIHESNPNAPIPPSLTEQAGTTEPNVVTKTMTFGTALLGLVFPIVILLTLTRADYKDEASRWES